MQGLLSNVLWLPSSIVVAQTTPTQGIAALPDGNYHLFLTEDNFLQLQSSYLSADFKKEGDIIKGGLKYGTAGISGMSLPRTICFGGFVKGNVITNRRALELEGDSVKGVLEEVQSIDFAGANIRRLTASDTNTLIQTCSDTHNFYDQLDAVEADGEEVVSEADAAATGALVKSSVDMFNIGEVRKWYRDQVQKAISEIENEVLHLRLSLKQGAERAYELRNYIREMARDALASYGRVLSEAGEVKLTLEQLRDKKASILMNKRIRFADLNPEDQARVLWDMLKSAGKVREKVSTAAQRIGLAGRVLGVLAFVMTAFTIATAKDKVRATKEEAAAIAGGVSGGEIGGWIGRTFLCTVFPVGRLVCVFLTSFAGMALGGTGGKAFLDEISRPVR